MSVIGFVNGGNGNITVAGTTCPISYTPSSSADWVVVVVRFNNTVSGVTCKDNNNNFLNTTVNNGNVYQFYGQVSPDLSYNLNWTTSRTCDAVIMEFSNVVGIGVSGKANSGTGTLPSIQVVTTKVNSWIIAGLSTGGNQTYTANTGNLREQQHTSTASAAGVDNTAVNAGTPVTCSANIASVTWLAITRTIPHTACPHS